MVGRRCQRRHSGVGTDGRLPARYECSFDQVESNADGDLCREISAADGTTACAASTGNVYDAPTFSGGDVVAYIDAIKAAGARQGDAAQCPSYGGRAPIYDGRSSSVEETAAAARVR